MLIHMFMIMITTDMIMNIVTNIAAILTATTTILTIIIMLTARMSTAMAGTATFTHTCLTGFRGVLWLRWASAAD